MATTSIANHVVQFDGKTVTISHPKNGNKEKLRLTLTDLRRLQRFVDGCSGKQINDRKSYRVPLAGRNSLTVYVEHRSRQIKVCPSDISVSGIMVKPENGVPLNLQCGEMVKLKLCLGDVQCSCDATVKHKGIQGYGLEYSKSILSNRIVELNDIKEIVMELQRQWLSERAENVR